MALGDIQGALYARALARRDEHTTEVSTRDEAIEAGKVGFARVPWREIGPDGEDDLKRHTLSVRCIQRADGSIPTNDGEDDLYCIVARSY